MTAPGTLILHVFTTWSLPGLGLLALPKEAAPALAAYELHTVLAVAAVLPGGARRTATATVEEVSRPESPAPTRGLLLEWEVAIELPAGTEIWLLNAPMDPYAGLS